jgi:AcrR family transcriptional regulator
MTEVEQSRRERKKEETKDRIFKAAFALFKRQGVEATTIDEICAKADVAKGTFFNYFPPKEAVFGYLADWFAQAEAESAQSLRPTGRPADHRDVL